LEKSSEKFKQSVLLTFLEFLVPLFFVVLMLLEQGVVDDMGIVHGAPA